MLTGRFGDTSGRPYIEGRLSLPRLGIAANVSFLIDTGADRSVLMPLDGTRINLDYSCLENETRCTGIGGSSVAFHESGVISFSDGIAIYMYEVGLLIPKPKRGTMKTPSVLGRDVLNRLVIRYDFQNLCIEMEYYIADQILPVPNRE